MRPPLLAIALAALLFPSCVLDTSSPGVFLATSPPGARVYVDGVDSGFATPCAIDLEPSDAYEVEFRLPGYAPASRQLVPVNQTTVVPWSDGDIGATKWRFPIFLTFTGFFFPFRDSSNLAPKRVYVPLEVATEAVEPEELEVLEEPADPAPAAATPTGTAGE